MASKIKDTLRKYQKKWTSTERKTPSLTVNQIHNKKYSRLLNAAAANNKKSKKTKQVHTQ